MGTRIGTAAPDLLVQAYVRGEAEARHLTLGDSRGTWTVLFFYPRDFTFICPTELQEFARLQPQFEQEHAVVLGASTDSYHSHKAWFESDPRLAQVTYPVLADTSQKLAVAFDVLT